ncbi:hypothetical protein I6E61_07200 [Psychrobacter sp. NZS113]|uniref:hypothetical protein n=1 Tax=Psychrobacter sp. NZS113 TaxID=2792045 RepID=UPI0018CDE2BC|nr:hypothetical protein [Psychrobacter sp. NZS113]MBH0096165.1 hypothetical protein [Psychrobacter sp. NZS113]
MRTIFLTAFFFLLVGCTDVDTNSVAPSTSTSDKGINNSSKGVVSSVNTSEKKVNSVSDNTESHFITPDKKSSNSFILPEGFVIERTIREDFNNNLIDDYIYLAYSEELSDFSEFWVQDNGRLFLTLSDLPSQNYHFFIDVDNDNQKELISIRGYEDGSDAKIAKINFDKKSLDTLFYFNPIIYSNDKYYWGYAWDIDSLIINNQKEIYSSYTNIKRDDDYAMAENQVNLPTLIFSPNKIFEPLIEHKIQTAKYRPIEKIVEFSMNNDMQ